MTDTPKTDREAVACRDYHGQSIDYIPLHFARGLERENAEFRKDTKRLDWLRHHVSGKEFRRIGICVENSGDLDELRQRIDDMIANASDHRRSPGASATNKKD